MVLDIEFQRWSGEEGSLPFESSPYLSSAMEFEFPEPASVPVPVPALALLPSCTMDFPACSAPLDPVQMPSPRLPVPGGRLSTPVMHPKLVDTLKSMISPYPSSPYQSGGLAGNGMNEASTEQRRKGIVRRGAGNRKPGLRRQHQQQHCSSQPKMCGLSSSSPEQQFHFQHHLPSGGAELMTLDDDEAAVVPVDLIQNRRPFRCAYADCNKTFKNPQTMRMHHKTHYSEDSSCRIADGNAKVFSSYKARYNKKIPSRCPECRRAFVGLYELRRHFGRKHSVGEKQFACHKCCKRFYIEVDLRDHEKLCGEPILCKCGMKFAFKCNLVAHKKGHPKCQDPPSEAASDTSTVKAIVPPARATRKGKWKSKLRMCVMASSASLPRLLSPWSPSSPSAEALPPPVYSHEQLSSDLCFLGSSTIGSTPLSSSGIFDSSYMPYISDFNYPSFPQDQVSASIGSPL